MVAITINADPPKDRSEKREPTVAYDQASPEQLQKVKFALGEGITVHEAQTIKSYTHRLAYYVGASFSINVDGGEEKVVGIWIMNGEKNNPKLTFSVDEMAYQFSRVGRAKDTKVGASAWDSEAQALKSALKE